MAWIYRNLHLVLILLGAAVIAGCSSETPQGSGTAMCTEFYPGENGELICADNVPETTGGAPGAVPNAPVAVPTVPVGVPSGGSTAAAGAGGATGIGGMAVGGDTGVGGSTTPPVGMPTPTGSIIVSAGDKARDHTIVTFPYPAGVGQNLALEDEAGNQIPLQVDAAGNATFVLTSLAAGAQATFSLVALPEPLPAAVTNAIEMDGRDLNFRIGDSLVFRWLLGPDNFKNKPANRVRAGYIYPFFAPSGTLVIDDYPESHPHQHGIWSAWTSTTFRGHSVDFWNSQRNQGLVTLESMEGVWDGPVHGGLIGHIDHLDFTQSQDVVALKETWVVTLYKTHEGAPPYYVFDIDSVQVTATDDPLILEQYHYGGFGFRGHDNFNNSSNVTYLTSEGDGRSQADGNTARWCAQFGDTGGGVVAGMAALDHPENVRHPQGMRVNPTVAYFAFLPTTPSAGGRYTIEVGEPHHSRFRVVSYDGPADAALLNRLWDDYADPPAVQVMP